MNDFDLLVIGAGPAGYVGAIRAAQLGAKVCLVERADVGGVCLNRGCIPTKTLTGLAELLEKTRTFQKLGIRIEGNVVPDLARAVQRKREIVSSLVRGIRTLLAANGVTLVSGEASFADQRTVEVRQAGATRELSANKILIATGSEASELPNLPFDGSAIISSSEALELEEVPRSVLVVGAGAIGCEFAFIFSALGSAVTVVEIMDRVLPLEDCDVSAVIEREFKKRRVTLVTSDSVASSFKSDSGVRCTFKNGKEIEVAKVLVSVGRRLNTGGLRLENAGVGRGEKNEVAVNEAMETNVAGIYAAGDVAGRKMYAHSASREAIVAVSNAAGQKKAMDYSAVPSCVFTRPQVASVGMTEKGATDKGLEVKVGVFNLRGLGMAHVLDETSGMVKIVADAKTDEVLGVHIVGAHACELIHEGVVAVANKLTATALGETIHAHPTLSEAVMEAAEAVHGLSIHSSG
ncbi:MAG: dihydrolipoyl dehydrogenase [Candidatus Eisenbacteria bacterium]|nr:dihydrolipoyl dehydrogenase [Candidatus Eisenbacteria bacterium]